MPSVGIATEHRTLGRAERKDVLGIAKYTFKKMLKRSVTSHLLSLLPE